MFPAHLKCGPFFYLGVSQLEKLFSYLNENILQLSNHKQCCMCMVYK